MALVVLVFAGLWVGASLYPSTFVRLFAEEAHAEKAADLLLLMGIVAWALLGLRHRAALWVALYLSVLLLEETDWGLVYGLDLGGSLLLEWFGHDSFHELSPPGAAFYAEVQHYLCAPLLLFGLLGWLAHPLGARRHLALPNRNEVGALIAALSLYVVWPSPLPAPLDDRGIVQLAVYGLMLVIATRRLPDLWQGSNSLESPVAPVAPIPVPQPH